MRNKAVAPARKCLHESRTLGRISENFAQPHYRIVQSMIKINKRIARPEPVPQFLARKHIARLFEENGENLERLLGHLQSQVSVPKILTLFIPEILSHPAIAGRYRTLSVPQVVKPVGRREENVRNVKASRSRDSAEV